MAATKVSLITTALPDIFYEDPEPVEDGMQQAPVIVEIAYLLTAYFKSEPEVFVSAGRVHFLRPRQRQPAHRARLLHRVRCRCGGHTAKPAQLLDMGSRKASRFRAGSGVAKYGVKRPGAQARPLRPVRHSRILEIRPYRRRTIRAAAYWRAFSRRRVSAIRTAFCRGRHRLGIQRSSRFKIPFWRGTRKRLRHPRYRERQDDKPGRSRTRSATGNRKS